jgi:hypothetical protein
MFSRAQQLEAEEEFYSKQDALRERYACQIEDARREALIWQEEQEYMTKVWDAGFGTDFEAYEAYWKRTFEYYETQRD